MTHNTKAKLFSSDDFSIISDIQAIHTLESDSYSHYTCMFPAGSSLGWWEKGGFGPKLQAC